MIHRRHILASIALMASALLLAAQATAQGLVDSDGDGMPDAVEDRLSTSTLAVMESDPSLTDTDADGIHDLAEWVLTGEASSAGVPSIVPAVRVVANRAPGESWARVYIGTVGDPEDFDFWAVKKSVGVSSAVVDVEPYLISETTVGVGLVPVMLFGLSVRVADLSADPEHMTSIAVAGIVGTDIMPASLVLFLDADGVPSVQYIDDPSALHHADPNESVPMHVEALDALIIYGLGSGQGQVGTDPPATEAEMVCGVADRREPTGTPGLLRSVVLATGCTSGAFACVAGVCTMSGVGQDKPVIDIFALIPAGG